MGQVIIRSAQAIVKFLTQFSPHRINKKLKRKLDESGWTDDVKDKAKGELNSSALNSSPNLNVCTGPPISEESRKMSQLNIRTLEKTVGPYAHGMLSLILLLFLYIHPHSCLWFATKAPSHHISKNRSWKRSDSSSRTTCKRRKLN